MRLHWRENFPVLKCTLLSKWLEIKVRKFQPCPYTMNLLRISGHLHLIFLGTSQQLRGSSVNKFTRPSVLRSLKKTSSLLHVFTVCLTGQPKGQKVQTLHSVQDRIIVISRQCISLHLYACQQFIQDSVSSSD